MNPHDVVVVDGLRTAIGSWQGALTLMDADKLVAPLITELVRRNGLKQSDVDM
jgi:acetyl-CoA acetyltransferase